MPQGKVLLFIRIPVFMQSVENRSSTYTAALFFQLPDGLIFRLFPHGIDFAALPAAVTVLPEIAVCGVDVIASSFFEREQGTCTFCRFQDKELSFVAQKRCAHVFIEPGKHIFDGQSVQLETFLQKVNLRCRLVPEREKDSQSGLFFQYANGT